MSWFGLWFGGGGGGITINDGVYVEVDNVSIEAFIEASDLTVSVNDDVITIFVIDETLEIEVCE